MQKKQYPEGDLNPFTYLAIVLILIFCVYGYHAGEATRRMEASVFSGVPGQAPKLPEGVARMQGERVAFFGPQLSADQLTGFLASYQIDHVIDLAHEAAAEQQLPDRAERFIVEKTGANYWPLNIEGRGNRLNQQVLGVIDSLVDSGRPVFVHCLHGIHRAGVVKGRAYARDERTWAEIVDILGWESVVDNDQHLPYVNDVWEQVFNRNAKAAR